jgi:mannose-6-phosphate isomerase-like protein (cupin superfamily)
MDIQRYIESGVLEEYCLGLLGEADQAYLIQMTMLYPEIKEELTAIELAMERWSASTAIEPAPGLKKKIMAELGFDNITPLDKNGLPVINKHADHQTWLKTLDHLIPAAPSEDFLCIEIRKDNNFQQMLVVTKMNVPEEEHEDYLESFFILKGQCECTVGNEFYKLEAGDFLEIPLHVKHNILVTSPYIVAILQYQFV